MQQLTEEQICRVVESYLGVSPKYFVFKKNRIMLDTHQMMVDGVPVPSDGIRVWERGELWKKHYAEGKVVLNP